MRRVILSVLVSAATVTAVTPALAAKPVRLGPNLVPNPSFEQSALEGTPATPPGSLPQPVLPTGWTFEGATILFDHSPNLHHSGKRAAAVSGTLSGGRKLCETGSCVDNPANAVKDATALYTTLPPHWRTKDPIPVQASRKYVFTVWGGTSLVTAGEGYDVLARWVDANGLPVAQQTIVRSVGASTRNFAKIASKPLGVPKGATGVVLLLGQTDDAWIGQVYFDDAYFGTYG